MAHKLRKMLLLAMVSTFVLTGCGSKTSTNDPQTTQEEVTKAIETGSDEVDLTVDYSKKLILAEYLIGTGAHEQLQAVIDELEPELAEPPVDTLTAGYITYQYNDDITKGDTGLCFLGVLMNGYDNYVENISGTLTIKSKDDQEIGKMDVEFTAEALGKLAPKQSRVYIFTLPSSNMTNIELSKKVAENEEPLNIYFNFQCESYSLEEPTEETPTETNTLDEVDVTTIEENQAQDTNTVEENQAQGTKKE